MFGFFLGSPYKLVSNADSSPRKLFKARVLLVVSMRLFFMLKVLGKETLHILMQELDTVGSDTVRKVFRAYSWLGRNPA